MSRSKKKGVRLEEVREYRIWKGMKSRCKSPSMADKNWQKKGIKVCEEWLVNYDNFLNDMGPCPEGFSLERVDNNGNYCKENCRWASRKEQNNNRDSNTFITYNEKTQTLRKWSEELGINYNTLHSRVCVAGVPFEDAIRQDSPRKFIEYKGEKKLLMEWSRLLNIPYNTLCYRKRCKWSIEEMFEIPCNVVKVKFLNKV